MSHGIIFDSILLQVTINLTSIAFLRLAPPGTYRTSLVDVHIVVSVAAFVYFHCKSCCREGGAREYDWFNSTPRGWLHARGVGPLVLCCVVHAKGVGPVNMIGLYQCTKGVGPSGPTPFCSV